MLHHPSLLPPPALCAPHCYTCYSPAEHMRFYHFKAFWGQLVMVYYDLCDLALRTRKKSLIHFDQTENMVP